jgi:hypothetical protein
MPSNFSALLVAAVLSLIGAIIVQVIVAWKEAGTRAKDRETIRASLAQSVFFKLSQIYSHYRAIEKQLAEARKFAGREELSWQDVVPPANRLQEVHFNNDERAIIFETDRKLLDGIMNLDEVHNSNVATLALYADRRLALTDLIPTAPKDVAGEIVKMRGVELNALLQYLTKEIPRDRKNTWALLLEWVARMREKFKIDIPIAERTAGNQTEMADKAIGGSEEQH